MGQYTQINTILNLLTNKKYRNLFHLLFWIVVFSEDINSLVTKENENYYITIVILSYEIFIVYFNIYYLFKKYLIKGNVKVFIIYNLIFTIIYILINVILLGHFAEKIHEKYELDAYITLVVTVSIMYAFRMFSVIGTAIGITLLKHYFIKQNQLLMLKKNSLENELLYLKNQINPHFLFNALNNIYTLQSLKNKNTAEAIILLSELLRYQLYECSAESILLENEVEYLRNYIKFELLRKKVKDINLTYDNNNSQIYVAPFIFLPFLENAIKFSLYTKCPSVQIFILIVNNTVEFLVKNNYDKNQTTSVNSGIGLKNVKRRLDLLYDNKYSLCINKSDDFFEVVLNLPI